MNFDGGTVRYTIEADTSGFTRDLESLDKEFNRLSDKFDSLFKKNVFDEKQIGKVTELQSKMADYGKIIEETEEGTEEYEYALSQANKTMDEFAKLLGETRDTASETVKPVESLGSAIAKMAGNAGLSALKGLATGAATALTGLATKGIATTNFLETSQIAMSGLLGSMELGTKALSKAADFWQNNPFQRTDVTGATKTLVQYGRTVNQLSDDLKILGNVSLSTGMGIDELALRYGRVASSGRAMTQDIEMMAARGVPIYRELQKILGATTDEVRKFASEGKISFETFKQAMEGAVDPEAMAAYENTLARQTDRLKGSIAILAGELAGYKIVNDEFQISTNGLYENWVKLTNTLATGLRTSGLREGLAKIGEALGSAMDKIFQFYQVWDEENQKWVQHSATLETIFNTISKITNFIGENSALLIPIALGALSVVGSLINKVPVLNSLLGGVGTSLSGIGGLVKKLISDKPAIAGVIALFGVGLVNAFKNSESFRESIQKLVSALGSIFQKLMPVVQTFIQAFTDFASSYAVTTVLELIAAVLADIAQAISEIPVETLTVMFGVIVGLKMASISPWLYWGTALSLAYSWIKKIVEDAGGLKTVLNNIGTAIHNFFTGVLDYFKRFSLENIGKNFIAGFFKGTSEALAQGKQGLWAGFTGIITGVKNIFGIASPSKVMYGIGQNIGLGLANGITDSSDITQKAMDSLASDVLKKASKVIGNMSDFGLIDYNSAYKQWKKVANLFTIGSEQYESALEKMEDARKNVNLEIIKLQKEYNTTLDDTVKKIQRFYNIFDDVSTKGGKNASQIIRNLDKQVAQTAEWAEAQRIISNLDLDPRFIKELQELGVSSVSELSSIANMTSSELEQMNELWLAKQGIAETAAVEQLSDYKNDVLDQIDKLADGIDGETVNVEDVGGRLVASIGEGITGAIPTLAESMAQLQDYIADAREQLSKTASGDTGGGVPNLGGNPPDTDPNTDPQTAAEDLGKTLGTAALAGLGGVLLAKLGKWLLPKLGQRLGGLLSDKGGILGKLGGIFGKGGKAVVDSQGMGHMDLSGINKTTAQLGETSKGLTKANEWLKTIAKGALAIIAIAAAIAAIAGAIWVMDKALAGIDWETFISKLGMIAVATAAMGAFSFAVGKLGAGQMALGAGVIVLLALDIAAIGAAIGVANYAMDGIEWGEFMSNIGMMAVAIVAMGALSAIAGIPVVAGLVALGALVIAALAADIILVSTSIAYMDEMIPNDLDRVRAKIGILCEAIGSFQLLTGVAGVFALVEGLGILVVKGIADEIAQVATAIGLMSLAIPNDLEMVQQKINLVRDTIALMGESNFGWALGNLIQSARIAALKPTIDEFVNIGESLKRLEGINVSQDDVFGIMSALQAVIGSGDTLARFAEVGNLAAQSVAQGVQQGLQFIYQAGNAIQSALWQGVQDKFADEYQQGIYLAYNVRDGIYSIIGEFQRVGAEIQSQFWWGIQSRFSDEYYQGRSLGETFRQGLYDIDYGNAGWWAVQGFINGANNRAYGWEGVYHTGWWVADTFLRGLKDRGGQGSPWKTTIESGVFAGEGLVEGLKSMESEVVSEAEALADGIVGALDLTGTSISPELSVRTGLSPLASEDEFGYTSGRGIVVNNNVTAYTEYDLQQNLADLSWELSKV